jgi:DNA-nicking Smr family endonuclease
MEEDFVRIPVEDSIDLHTFRPAEISSAVEEYLHECVIRGLGEVRIVHGRGKGVQRRIVQSLLSRHPSVISFNDAPPERGGRGATIVYLSTRASDTTD